MLRNILDFTIRNQWLVLGLFGAFLGVLSGLSTIKKHREGIEISIPISLGGGYLHNLSPLNIRLPFPWRQSAKYWIPGTFAFLLAIAGILWGRSSPVPKTIALESPPIALDQSKQNLIIFIHGWRGDADGTWQRFPSLVRMDRRFVDTDVVAINYPIFIARRNLTIGETATWLTDQFKGKGIGHFKRIAIVAHSIGGLVSRKLILHGNQGFNKVRLLIEIATPHLGTERYAQLLGDLGIPIKGNDIVMEVKSGSDWLRELRDDWNARERVNFTHCFTSPNDGLVSTDSALFQCDHFHYLPGFGHTEMVKPDSPRDERYVGPATELDDFLHPNPALETTIVTESERGEPRKKE